MCFETMAKFYYERMIQLLANLLFILHNVLLLVLADELL